MKHTILAMTFLAASVFARQAGIYDKSPEISASLQNALESALYDVVRLTPPQLCDEHQLKALDLVVIPDAQVIPAPALPMIRSFLQARKTLLLLGPRPFNILQYNDGEDWLTENEIRERRANIMSSPVSLQPTAVWKRSSRDSNIKGSLEVHGNSIHYMATPFIIQSIGCTAGTPTPRLAKESIHKAMTCCALERKETPIRPPSTSNSLKRTTPAGAPSRT